MDVVFVIVIAMNPLPSGVPLAVVGGSDLKKVTEQLGDSLEDVQSRFDYVFTENGLVGFKVRMGGFAFVEMDTFSLPIGVLNGPMGWKMCA